MATNKSDISTGFDIEAELSKPTLIKFLETYEYGSDSTGSQLAKEATDAVWDGLYQQIDAGAKNLVDQAEEIFHEEAAMSHWSHNMANNAIDKYYSCKNSGNTIAIDARVGVNENKIGNPSNWQSFIISKGKNKGTTGYFYKSKKYRMYPGRDYSGHADAYAVFIAGFCERAEGRFDSL